MTRSGGGRFEEVVIGRMQAVAEEDASNDDVQGRLGADHGEQSLGYHVGRGALGQL